MYGGSVPCDRVSFGSASSGGRVRDGQRDGVRKRGDGLYRIEWLERWRLYQRSVCCERMRHQIQLSRCGEVLAQRQQQLREQGKCLCIADVL